MSAEKLKEQILALAPLLISLLAIANTFLSALGYPCIGIADSDITTVVSALATVVSTVWAWWHNNNITHDAQVSQTVLNALKDGEVTTAQVESLVDNAELLNAIQADGMEDRVMTLLTNPEVQEIADAVSEGKDIKVEIDE